MRKRKWFQDVMDFAVQPLLFFQAQKMPRWPLDVFHFVVVVFAIFVFVVVVFAVVVVVVVAAEAALVVVVVASFALLVDLAVAVAVAVTVKFFAVAAFVLFVDLVLVVAVFVTVVVNVHSCQYHYFVEASCFDQFFQKQSQHRIS